MSILTKVAKGVAFGDVSNQAVRNVLTEISKNISGNFTEQEMHDTLDHFGWKCPYTDRDLRASIANKDGSYATDHIYPQNKEWCGLNVKGNLVIVDKAANAAKKGMDVETFLLHDKDFFGELDAKTRQDRLQAIKDFQQQCGYDPDRIRTIVSPLVEAHYVEVRANQDKCISDTLDALKVANIHTVTKAPSRAETVVTATTKSKKRNSLPELIFYPADEQQFKKELLNRKKAHFVLTYDSGAIKTSPWKADKLDSTSDIRGNIQSRPFWRAKKKEGLVKVEVFVD